jgi:hypothetical protein
MCSDKQGEIMSEAIKSATSREELFEQLSMEKLEIQAELKVLEKQLLDEQLADGLE